MIYAGKRKKIFLCIIALALVVCTLLLTALPTFALAAENDNKFDDTDVLEDLTSSKINGKAFDLKNYPFDENGEIQVISFVEYCYSYKANLRGNYGLYVYIYNPQGLNLSTSNKQNKIQMAVAYDADGNPTDYQKFNLEFCSKTESGDYKNLFYKFKVVDRQINGKGFAERVNSAARRYDVSGIELTKHGSNTAKEYGVCGTFIFTGYAEGYGPDANAKSTLNCDVEYLDVLLWVGITIIIISRFIVNINR